MSERITMDKQTAYKIVFDDLCKCDMFKGIYDAEHGSDKYMHGVSAVMESIACNVSEECYETFSDMFITNMCKSEEKASNNRKHRHLLPHIFQLIQRR
jgi:hypothetical protein